MHPTKQPPEPPPRNRHERRKAATKARQKAQREAKKPRWNIGPAPVPPMEMKLAGKSLTVSVADEADEVDFSGGYLNLGPDGFSIAGVRGRTPIQPVDEAELRAHFDKDPHAKAIVDSMSKRTSDEEA